MAVMVCSSSSGLWECAWMCRAGSRVSGPALGQEPESPLEKSNKVEFAVESL